jgi:hypothetical protein
LETWKRRRELYVRLAIDSASVALAYSFWLFVRYEFDVPPGAWFSLGRGYILGILPAHLAANYFLADYRPSLSTREGLLWRLFTSAFLAGLITVVLVSIPQGPLGLTRPAPMSVIWVGSVSVGLFARALRVPFHGRGVITEVAGDDVTDDGELIVFAPEPSELLELSIQYRADANSIDQKAGVLLGLSGVFVGLVGDSGASTAAESWTLLSAAAAAIASLFALVMPGGSGLQAPTGPLFKNDQSEAVEHESHLLRMRRNPKMRMTALSLGALALGGAIVGAVVVRV